MVVQSMSSGEGKKSGHSPITDDFLLYCEPVARANSFVGTEEYLAPEVINAAGHAAGALLIGQVLREGGKGASGVPACSRQPPLRAALPCAWRCERPAANGDDCKQAWQRAGSLFQASACSSAGVAWHG